MTLIEFAHEHFTGLWCLSVLLGYAALDMVERLLSRRRGGE